MAATAGLLVSIASFSGMYRAVDAIVAPAAGEPAPG
jgi:hypothetical protein